MPIYPNRLQPIRNINQNLYLVKAVLPIEMIGDRIEDMKNYLDCEIAFKVNKEGAFYFCSEIEEVDYEEIQ